MTIKKDIEQCFPVVLFNPKARFSKVPITFWAHSFLTLRTLAMAIKPTGYAVRPKLSPLQSVQWNDDVI